MKPHPVAAAALLLLAGGASASSLYAADEVGLLSAEPELDAEEELAAPSTLSGASNFTASSIDSLSGSVVGIDSEGGVIGTSTLRRQLEANPFDLFKPLTCNAGVETKTCVSWNTVAITPGSPAVIPCGVCVEVDVADGTEIVLPDGLDIQGKLSFPPNKKVTVKTSHVYLQGILHIRDTNKMSPANQSVKFYFEGDAAQSFTPHANNSIGCAAEGGSCDAGKKPFLIAGGKLDVEGWSDMTCPSWTSIQDVVYEDMTTTDFPGPAQPPAGCAERYFSDAKFDAADNHGWAAPLGAIAEVVTEGSSTFLRVSNRTYADGRQGAELDLSSDRHCVQSDRDYLFAAKIRLTKPGGGGATSCSTDGTACPMFVVHRRHRDHDEWEIPAGVAKRTMLPEEGTATTDGEWFPVFGSFTFSSSEADPNNVYVKLTIEGPEEGVVIDVDDLYVGLPYDDQYPDASQPGEVCSELFPADPSADGYFDPPRYPYPLYNARSSSRFVRVMTDDADNGNNFYRITGRMGHDESVSFPLPPGCVRAGARYEISFRARINHPDDFPSVKAQFIGNGASTSTRYCPTMGGGRGWVSCDVAITLDQADEDSKDYPEYFRLHFGQDRTFDFDLDDVSIRLTHGPVKTLVVQEEVEHCWGAGSEVMVATNVQYFDEEQLATVESVTKRGDGLADLKLSAFVVRPTTMSDDPRTATEVALLTRNVIFDSAQETNNVGAYMLVKHTAAVPQTLSGVEIKNFGQNNQADKYSVGFAQCDDLSGSAVSKNVIRDSSWSGLVLAGTHNVTVLENVAYNTRGHSFMLRDGKEWENRVEFNLAARSKNPGGADYAGFLVRSVKNYIVGNAVAGAEDRGFSFMIEGSIKTPSRGMPGGDPNPRREEGLDIRDNVAHSCEGYGFILSSWTNNNDGSVPFAGFRIYKNLGTGAYLRGRYVKLHGSYLADNRYKSVDLHYCDNCEIKDTEIRGSTPLVMDQYKAVNTWHQCIGDPSYPGRYAGVEMKAFLDNDNYGELGQRFTNVRFGNFNDTGCDHAKTIVFEKHRRMPHYDLLTQMSGVINEDAGDFMVDFCSASDHDMEVQDVLFTDLDSSLHPNGPGSYAGASALVSDYPYMKNFARGTCYDLDGRCASYCEGLCLRYVNFLTTIFETEDVTLRVKDLATNKTIEVGGNFEYEWTGGAPDTYDMTYDWRERVFSAPLPDSTFEAQFLKNGQPYWPVHVKMAYETAPTCGGAQKGSVALVPPPLQAGECDELAKNGDAEYQGGNYTHWYHVSGGVAAEAGVGADGSHAIVSTSRNEYDDGLGFYVDTRCVKANVGREYELTAMMKLENADGTPWSCDPDSTSNPDGCPRFNARGKVYDESSDSYSSVYFYMVSAVTRPYNDAGYTLVQGTFVMPPDFANSDSVLFYFSKTDKDVKMYLDDVSLHPVSRPADRLVLNGDFESPTLSTAHWEKRDKSSHGGTLELVTPGADGTGHALKSSDRGDKYQGMGQYLDPSAFVPGQEYQVSAKFRLTKAGMYVTCDPNADSGLDTSCPEITVKTWVGDLVTDAHTYPHVGFVADPGTAEVWGTLHGTFFPTQEMLDSFKLFAFVEYPGPAVDIELDDFSIVPYTLDCDNVVKNGDFEVADGRDWTSEGTPSMTAGAGASAYALLVSDRTQRTYGAEQSLETACLELHGAGSQYLLTARFRLSDAGGNTVSCNVNVILGTDGCPVATLESEQVTGSRYRDVAAVVGTSDAAGWYEMRGIFELYDADVESDKVVLRFKDAPVGVNMAIDDVVMTKLTAPIV